MNWLDKLAAEAAAAAPSAVKPINGPTDWKRLGQGKRFSSVGPMPVGPPTVDLTETGNNRVPLTIGALVGNAAGNFSPGGISGGSEGTFEAAMNSAPPQAGPPLPGTAKGAITGGAYTGVGVSKPGLPPAAARAR